jgi:hypothetical protein
MVESFTDRCAVTAVLTRSQRRILARKIISTMVRRGDQVIATKAWPGVKVAVQADPMRFIEALAGEAGKRTDAPLRASRTIGP